MKESVTYQAILEEGLAEGIAKGIAKGEAIGETKGRLAALMKFFWIRGVKNSERRRLGFESWFWELMIPRASRR